MINRNSLLNGIPNICPLGANTPPCHLPLSADNPVIVVVSAVFVSGSIINMLVLFAGIPYYFSVLC